MSPPPTLPSTPVSLISFCSLLVVTLDWPTNSTGENKTGEPRPLDWRLSWAPRGRLHGTFRGRSLQGWKQGNQLSWVLSWALLWALSWAPIDCMHILGVRVPNPPGANPLVAERAPWRSLQSRVTGGRQPIGNPYRFLSFLLHTWQPLCDPNSHSWGRLFQLPGG